MTVTRTKGTKDAKSPQPMVTVVSQPVVMDSSDISTWKNSVNSARYGRRNQLYRLYENLLVDGLLSRSIEKRIEAITNSELVFMTDKKEPVQEIIDLIDTPEFEKFLREIMLAQAWGGSVIDVMSILPLQIFSVPRRNINFEKKLILPDEYADNGLEYEKDPYIIEVVPNDPFGFIYKAAPYVIYKRGGYGDWAQFVELFGMPFRLGKYSAYDTNTRDEIVKSLKMFGSAPWAVVPKEGEFEFMQNNATGNGQLYNLFIDRCDKEILITVLGQTMTTQDGSSKSQSETHREVEKDINKSDSRFVQRILNNQLTPILEMAGLPVKGGKFSFKEQGETLTTAQRVTIALSIKKGGIAVADDYFYETSGIPKPTPEQISKQQPPAPINQDPNNPVPANPDPNNPAPEVKKPKHALPVKMKLSDSISRVFNFFVQALDRGAPLKF